MIEKESSWKHSNNENETDPRTGDELIAGEIVFGRGSGPDSNDIGLCQINDKWHSNLNYSRLARDWRYNLEAGINILIDAYAKAVNFLTDNGIPRTAENLAIATYSAYNGGGNNVGRSFRIDGNGNYTIHLHDNDKGYLEYFRGFIKQKG